MDTDTSDLLDQGFAWTSARIAAVTTDSLDAPTPCGRWSLRDLLDHTIDTSGVFADALVAPAPDGPPVPSPAAAELPWATAFADIAARTCQGWAEPASLDRTYEVRFGTMPGPIMASANLLEVVVHGWDIGQATGEDLDIPDALAVPILEFAQAAISDEQRGDNFAADLRMGDTPSERLLAFLGRKSR
jgi:uncharacterized protein (TIGR03086 family)